MYLKNRNNPFPLLFIRPSSTSITSSLTANSAASGTDSTTVSVATYTTFTTATADVTISQTTPSTSMLGAVVVGLEKAGVVGAALSPVPTESMVFSPSDMKTESLDNKPHSLESHSSHSMGEHSNVCKVSTAQTVLIVLLKYFFHKHFKKSVKTFNYY